MYKMPDGTLRPEGIYQQRPTSKRLVDLSPGELAELKQGIEKIIKPVVQDFNLIVESKLIPSHGALYAMYREALEEIEVLKAALYIAQYQRDLAEARLEDECKHNP